MIEVSPPRYIDCHSCESKATVAITASGGHPYHRRDVVMQLCDECATRLLVKVHQDIHRRRAKPYPGQEPGEGFSLARDTTFGRLLDGETETD